MTTIDRKFITSPSIARARLSEWSMWWDEAMWIPFVEDENAHITGPGHQDPGSFIRSVYAYDQVNNPGHAEMHVLTDVAHQWVQVEDAEEGCVVPCAADAPGAVPVTTIWGVR